MSYVPGVYTEGMEQGYRLRVEQDTDVADCSPLTWDREDVTEDSPVYKQWARGDVYVVTVEKEVPYQVVGEEFAGFTRWLPQDDLGDCYLNADYTAIDVARQYGFPGVRKDWT